MSYCRRSHLYNGAGLWHKHLYHNFAFGRIDIWSSVAEKTLDQLRGLRSVTSIAICTL
jgi:hypothetical protein